MRFSLLIALFGLTLSAASLSPAAPAPRDVGPRYFYPTRVGDRMVYARSGLPDFTQIVAKVKKIDGGLRVTTNVVTDDGKESLSEIMEVSPAGVRMITDCFTGRPLPYPIWEIKSTPDGDATWSNRWPVIRDGVTVFSHTELVAKGWETVEVPAGRFKAVRIEQAATLSGETDRNTLWYALDVGWVKTQDRTSSTVLKTFTRGPIPPALGKP